MDPAANPSKRIAIVGLGYVGLPLAIQFARCNVSVLGLDIDESKVSAVNNGQSYIKHIAPKTIAEVLRIGRLSASTDLSATIKASPNLRLEIDLSELSGPVA